MKLSPYIESLKKTLEAAAAPGGKEVSETAALLSVALESSARLSMIEALSDATSEITALLDETSVEARLSGREIEFVVAEAAHPPIATAPAEPGDADETDADGKLARISLRLPESLKESVERAAGAENISVNSWLVKAITEAIGSGSRGGRSGGSPGRARFGRRFTGFAKA